MLVKCINNEGDSRLELGGIYIVNYKIRWEKSMTLVGMGGKYNINRFIDNNNEKLDPDFSHSNKRYNPPVKAGLYGYVMPIPNRLKTLKNKLYKIESVKVQRDAKSSTNRSFKKIRIKEDSSDWGWWYNAKNFLFFTNEEAAQIFREQKIEQITKKIT